MTHETLKPGELLLGEIETCIAGVQAHGGEIEPEKAVCLEREPQNKRDSQAIRIRNGQARPLGYLPRSTAAWLSPLVDADVVRLEGYIPAEIRRHRERGHRTVPLVLVAFAPEKGQHLFAKREVRSKQDALHEIVRQAYEDAQRYHDPELVIEMAEKLRLLGRDDLLPESRLLLALLPRVAREIQAAKGLRLVSQFRELVGRVQIGKLIRLENLSLFPLSWPDPQEPPYMLLADAIEQGLAVVEEASEAGCVPELLLVNRGARPVLVPEGEVLVGAKQNRVVNLTVLVAANSKFKLPVSCVEQGRWQYRSRSFQSAACAPPSLRSKKLRSVQRNRAESGTAQSDQGEVWQEVARGLRQSGAHSETSSLTDGYSAARERLDSLQRDLRLPSDAAGILVLSDLFDSPQTLATLWPRLCQAYCFDASWNSKPKQQPLRKQAYVQFARDPSAGGWGRAQCPALSDLFRHLQAGTKGRFRPTRSRRTIERGIHGLGFLQWLVLQPLNPQTWVPIKKLALLAVGKLTIKAYGVASRPNRNTEQAFPVGQRIGDARLCLS